jgi:ATP-binding cassette subfamily B multidrug efflux pump
MLCYTSIDPQDCIAGHSQAMKSLRYLLKLLRPYRLQVTLTSIGLIGLTGIELIFPAVIKEVIDRGLAGGQSLFLLHAGLFLLGLGVLRAFLAYGQRYSSEWISHRVAYDLRNRLYDHIQHLSFSFHDRTQSGQLISRTIEDVRSIQAFSGQGLAELARALLLFIGIVSLLFAENLRLALIAIAPMIPLILMTTQFGSRISAFFLAVDSALGELSSRLQESVSGIHLVRAFAREPYEIERFDQANRILYSARINVLMEWAKVMPSTSLLIALSTILILWFGGRMVIQGTMTLGEIVAFNSYLLLLSQPAQMLVWLVNSAGEAAAGLERTMEILSIVPDIRSPKKAIPISHLEGKVEFRNVSLMYQGESTKALRDIHLSVEPNQIVALIGPIGSGKTTLVNLIPRFYDVSRGAVLVDGIDVRQIELVSLRREIGIVLQSSVLFSTTIRENIAYGRPEADVQEILAASRAAQAHEFILDLPGGYETVVGERGVTLSGGQRQRIAIARALLLDPRILILDDSMASMDVHTEYLIQQALSQLIQGRTTFIIAQRLSTIRKADLIVVMDQGTMVEQGTHQQLIELNGYYRKIFDFQFRDQENSAVIPDME